MRTTASYIRIFFFIVIAFFLLMLVGAPDEPLSAFKELWFWGILGLLVMIMVAIEIFIAALKSILFKALGQEAQANYLKQEALDKSNRFKWIKEKYNNLLDGKPLEEEGEIILDHNYDGIKELDNNLPPWWVYGFYLTIIFAVVYLARYHVFDATDQAGEFEIEMEEARIAIAEYKKTAKNLVDVNSVELLTETADLNAGKAIFTASCVACHKADGGGGIGPNLTDSNWILGGGIKNVFNTISEGGRDGKGMVSWKSELKPLEMAQVASYLLTFEGTTPADPKVAEGEIWVDPDMPSELEDSIEVTDSTAVEILIDN
jgi:cytochrome c oxidase cbb3-type subunit 3